MNSLLSKHIIDERPFWPYFTAFDAALGRTRIATLARKHMQELRGDLAESVRKYECRFREETLKREREAVLRFVPFLKGGTCPR
jgi:hypothetical protein